jgi:hypothetical protein
VNEAPIPKFQEAILATHGAKARLHSVASVNEKFKGEPVWQGTVLVFELEDHPTARLCYAWEVNGEFTCVLHEGPVKSAVDAVRASLYNLT